MRTTRISAWVTAAAGAVTLALFTVPHSGRSYNYDESVTVGFYVRRGNLLEAVTDQRVFSNHPLLSGINWIVWHLGGQSESWQRVPAIAAGCACVAVVAIWCNRRFGLLPGAVATALLATNPLFVEMSSQARGYSMATLATVVATIEIERWWRSGHIRTRVYVAAIAAGLLAHLYTVIVFLGHGVATVITRRSQLDTWERAAFKGFLVAAPVYIVMAPTMIAEAKGRTGEFDPGFPAEFGDAVLGNTPALLLVTIGLLATMFRASSPVIWFAVAITGMSAAIWIVVHPFDLYSRFFTWTVPLAAMAIAAAVRRWRPMAAALLIVPLLTAGTLEANVEDEPDVRPTARAFLALRSEYGHTCTLGYFDESLWGYVDPPPDRATETDDCKILFAYEKHAQFLPERFSMRARLVEAPAICVASDRRLRHPSLTYDSSCG